MEMTYQLIDQITAASTTGQTGAKRDAGTQNKSDGGFDTMVREKQREANGTAGKAEAETGNEAPVAGEKPVADEDRIAMAAALLLQPQPVIVYVQNETGTEAVSELLPKQAVPEITELPEQAVEAKEIAELPEQAVEAEEITELPAQTLTERPAEVEAAPRNTEESAVETERPQPVQTDGAAAETVTAKAGPDRGSDETELPADTREGENEIPEAIPADDAPVFGYMEAAPFRVADSETAEQPLDLEAADAAQELGARIERALTDETGDTKVELTLSPASLGKLVVEITHSADGSLHVQLLASTVKAAALLEKNAGGLQGLLAARDRPQTTVEVRIDESERQQFLDPNGQRQNRNGAYQQQQQQQQQRRPQQEALRVEDFMSRLRLGLVDLDAAM